VISSEDAKTRRIIGLIAQILRMFGSGNAGALLKVFFNERSLDFRGEMLRLGTSIVGWR